MSKWKDTGLRLVKRDEALPQGVRKKKWTKGKTAVLVVLLVVVLAAGIWLFLTHHTFQGYYATSTVEFDNSSNNSYIKFGNNILKYSRDGAALLDEDGNQLWNQAYQMSDPVTAKNGDSVIIADQGGNTIEIFDEEGLRGEIQTGLPIEKAAVSGQGITAVILSNDSSAKIICYDTAGNILVENEVVVSESGYPVSLALSEDGCTLMVSYLFMDSNGMTSKLVYYDFSENTEDTTDKVTTEKEVEGAVVPELFYMQEGTSAAVGEGRLIFFTKGSSPTVRTEIKLKKEIHSVAYSENYIALVLENTKGKLPYELRIYNTNGKMTGSLNFKGDFSGIVVDGKSVILDAGSSCKIVSVKGICLYDGELENGASAILPVRGLFKYAIMRNDGMQMVRLIK